MFGFLAIILSCGDGEKQSELGYRPEFQGVSLSQPLLLRRLSLDLRGVMPSLEEYERLENDPDSLDELISEFMKDDRHQERLIGLFNEWLLTRVDKFNVSNYDYQLPNSQAFALNSSVGQEPLRLMAWVAANDRPWTDVVTSPYTMANELLQGIWPLEFIDDDTVSADSVWRLAQYTDGRPSGGVVMSNGLWWRYYTTPNNFSRTRAMVLTDLFLCENFLSRPIKFSAPALLERDSLNEVIRTDAACIGCHSTLDPIASALFGFWWFDLHDATEMSVYHPEREYLGSYYLEQDPSWFGKPLDSPADLGPLLATDSRYLSCSVEQVAKVLWDRETDLNDFMTLQDIEDEFVGGGLRFSSLLKAIVSRSDYRVGALLETADMNSEERLTSLRLLPSDVLKSAVFDLTGFRWTEQGYDMLENDTKGYRILLGGVDGVTVHESERNPTVSQQLALKRFTQAAADYVVEHDWSAASDGRILFGSFNPQELTAGDSAFDGFINQLHLRFYGISPGTERMELDKNKWSQLSNEFGPKQAWKSLVSVYLRDPSFWTY